MAGTFNTGLLSMTPENTYVNANAGTPVSGTWYDVVNYSGSGVLSSIATYAPTTSTAEWKITSDGGTADTILQSQVDNVLPFTGDSNNHYAWVHHLEFQSSLLVEVRRNGDTNAVHTWVVYQHLSKEFKREIIPAGQQVPNKKAIDKNSLEYRPVLNDKMYRSKVYDFDILLVWFIGQAGVSNTVVQLPEERLTLVYENDGTPKGTLYKPAFNTALKQDRVLWAKSNETTTKIISLHDGNDYQVSVNNGVMDSSKLPKLPKKQVIDVR